MTTGENTSTVPDGVRVGGVTKGPSQGEVLSVQTAGNSVLVTVTVISSSRFQDGDPALLVFDRHEDKVKAGQLHPGDAIEWSNTFPVDTGGYIVAVDLSVLSDPRWVGE